MIQEIKQSMQKALLLLEHLQLQLDMLSIGKLSPSIMTPKNLRNLLLDMHTRISPPLKLPGDPKADLWHFYKLLTCAIMAEPDKILVVIPIPLVESNTDWCVH